MKDVFGRTIKAGDTIAAGMTYGKSSVLRIGEVLYVNEKKEDVKKYRYLTHPDGSWIRDANGHNVREAYTETHYKWSVRVRWTHNGAEGYSGTKASTILGDSDYTYSKVVILPDGFADEFPPDIK